MYSNMGLTISRVFWDTDLVASRLTLSLSSFFWAIMLFWPGPSFDRDVYYQMGTILSENMWGFIFLVTSVIQFMIIESLLLFILLGITISLFGLQIAKESVLALKVKVFLRLTQPYNKKLSAFL